MDIEYNKPYSYKEICELMEDEEFSGGKKRKLQLLKWQKQYDIEKEGRNYVVYDKYEDGYNIADLRSSKYSSYIINIIVDYLSKKTNGITTLTYYDIFEICGLTNNKYHYAKNHHYKEVSKFNGVISEQDLINMFGISESLAIESNLYVFFINSSKLLKRTLTQALSQLKNLLGNFIAIQDTYILYKKGGKHICTDKEIKMMIDWQKEGIKEAGYKSMQQLIISKSWKSYNVYQKYVLTQLKNVLGYDYYSPAVKFIYNAEYMKTQSKYLNRKQLNQNSQEKILLAKSMGSVFNGYSKKFIKEYIAEIGNEIPQLNE